MLDDEAQQAARQLAARLEVSTSQAIRQAIVGYRDIVVGVLPETRQRRTAAFARLIELLDGRDPEKEIQAAQSPDGF